MRKYPKPLMDLIELLRKIPGIGSKNAERIAFFFLYSKENYIEFLTKNLIQIKQQLKTCSECFALLELQEECFICSDNSRDKSTICVVENYKDIFLFEDTLEYKGLYHILEGRLAPLEGITPQKLRIEELITRVNNTVTEIIIATSLDTDGDATAFYLSRLLKDHPIKITRLAKGLPFGLELEYADSLSLINSLKNREVIQ